MAAIITTSAPTATPDFSGLGFYISNETPDHFYSVFLEFQSCANTQKLRKDWAKAIESAKKLENDEWIRLDIAATN
jgi:hypothetical protein